MIGFIPELILKSDADIVVPGKELRNLLEVFAMSEKSRDSFKLVAGCSMTLIVIAATCAVCVRSIASDKRTRAELRIFGDCFARLLREYDSVVVLAGKEHSPTMLRQVQQIELSPDEENPNRVNVRMSLSIKKADILDSLRKMKEYEYKPGQSQFGRGPWPDIVVKETPRQLKKKYKDGFEDSGMRVLKLSVPVKNIENREALEPGCFIDLLVDYDYVGASGKVLSSTMMRGIKLIEVSANKTDPNQLDVNALLLPRQAEILTLAKQGSRMSIRVCRVVTK